MSANATLGACATKQRAPGCALPTNTTPGPGVAEQGRPGSPQGGQRHTRE